ncbi:hypothetical protein BDW69DRAFT_183309 [Aspergillus filifer]
MPTHQPQPQPHPQTDPQTDPTLTYASTAIHHIHAHESTIQSLSDAQNLGIRLIALETPISSISRRPLPLSPCFFLPVKTGRWGWVMVPLMRRRGAKTKAKTKMKERECQSKPESKDKSEDARNQNSARDPDAGDKRSSVPTHSSSSSSSASASAIPTRLPDTLTSSGSVSISTSLRPSSFLSSLSSACGSSRSSRSTHSEARHRRHQEDCHDPENEPSYPEILKCIASSKGAKLPKLPKTLAGRRSILTEKGPISKGKMRYNPTLSLEDPGHWRIRHVYEDTTYETPHYLAEMVLIPPKPGSRAALYSGDRYYVTPAEIRAIIRLMRLRVEMTQYAYHAVHPLLMISYMEEQPTCNTIDEYGMEQGEVNYRSARIIQAHHDGEKLVIQYSQRLLFSEEVVERSVERLLGYYFAEAVMEGSLAERKGEGDTGSWRMLQSWGSWKKWRISDASDGDDDLDEGEGWSLRHWFSKRLSFVSN